MTQHKLKNIEQRLEVMNLDVALRSSDLSMDLSLNKIQCGLEGKWLQTQQELENSNLSVHVDLILTRDSI